jgi:hypothetical protein
MTARAVVNVTVTARVYRRNVPRALELQLQVPSDWAGLLAIPSPEEMDAILEESFLNDAQGPKVKGIDHETLEAAAPRKRYCKALIREGDLTSCAVCTDDFRIRAYVRRLPCHHLLCSKCVERWATVTSATCPICRTSIVEDT